jgi:hypothetical protein
MSRCGTLPFTRSDDDKTDDDDDDHYDDVVRNYGDVDEAPAGFDETGSLDETDAATVIIANLDMDEDIDEEEVGIDHNAIEIEHRRQLEVRAAVAAAVPRGLEWERQFLPRTTSARMRLFTFL